MASGMTGNLVHSYSRISYIQFLISLDGMGNSFYMKCIFSSCYYLQLLILGVQNFKQILRVTCMIPVLMCVQNVTDLLVIEISIKAVHNNLGISWINKHQRVLTVCLYDVGIVVLKERNSKYSKRFFYHPEFRFILSLLIKMHMGFISGPTCENKKSRHKILILFILILDMMK